MFGGRYENRPAEVIVADEFIAEKSYKAQRKAGDNLRGKTDQRDRAFGSR